MGKKDWHEQKKVSITRKKEKKENRYIPKVQMTEMVVVVVDIEVVEVICQNNNNSRMRRN